MRIRLDKRFKKNVAGRFGKFDFEVGILKDGPHFEPKRGKRGLGGGDVITQYAGGPARRKSGTSTQSLSEVSRQNRERLGFNYLTSPFKRKSSEIVRFSREFFKLVFGRSQKRRAENLLQAIVRNPILRGDYGGNRPLTRAIKGFDRKMIDTAQLFKNIKAICRIRGK